MPTRFPSLPKEIESPSAETVWTPSGSNPAEPLEPEDVVGVAADGDEAQLAEADGHVRHRIPNIVPRMPSS